MLTTANAFGREERVLQDVNPVIDSAGGIRPLIRGQEVHSEIIGVLSEMPFSVAIRHTDSILSRSELRELGSRVLPRLLNST